MLCIYYILFSHAMYIFYIVLACYVYIIYCLDMLCIYYILFRHAMYIYSILFRHAMYIYLFDLSFKTGFIPSTLKTAKIVPIFKAGETVKFTNYRPISLLSSFSKLLEKVAANQIMKY